MLVSTGGRQYAGNGRLQLPLHGFESNVTCRWTFNDSLYWNRQLVVLIGTVRSACD